MGAQISLLLIRGTAFVAVGALHRLPLQSLIGDWEGNAWGDGKFPGFAAVSTIALLRYQSSIAGNADQRALNRTAELPPN
jgi:hypothetical protein